jgi:hypothetical protein
VDRHRALDDVQGQEAEDRGEPEDEVLLVMEPQGGEAAGQGGEE